MSALSDALLQAEQHTDLLILLRQQDQQLVGVWTHRLILNVSSPYWRQTLLTSGAHYNVVNCDVEDIQVALCAIQFCYHRSSDRIPAALAVRVWDTLAAWGVVSSPHPDRVPWTPPTPATTIPVSCRPIWKRRPSRPHGVARKKTSVKHMAVRWSHRISRKRQKTH